MADQDNSKTNLASQPQGVRDQVALLSFIDNLIKEKNDQSITPEQLPQVKAALLTELNEMINTRMVTLLPEVSQRLLDAMLESRLKSPDEKKQEAETQLSDHFKKFLKLDEENEVEASSFYATGKGKFIWQEVTYGQKRQKSGDDYYRGYLMIEPQDFSKAIDILKSVGSKRKDEGKRLDFKWLLMTIPPGITQEQWVEYIQNNGNFGKSRLGKN